MAWHILVLLNISSASVAYGRNVLFQDLNLVVDQRQRWGIVGAMGVARPRCFGSSPANRIQTVVVSRASGSG
jgi:hypothetical protein